MRNTELKTSKCTTIKMLMIGLVIMCPSISYATLSEIPLVDREFADHYSLQLRGLSFEADGELCEIYVYDSTNDSSAFGEITITNVDLGSTVFSKKYDNLPFDFNNRGGYGEAVLLPYNTNLEININGQEFSHFTVFLGADIVAHGSAYHGEHPDWTGTAYIVPEPTTILLLGLGSLVFIRKRRA